MRTISPRSSARASAAWLIPNATAASEKVTTVSAGTTERDKTGTCERVVETGGDCDPVNLNPECGLGSYCDFVSAKCQVAENFGGPSCSQATECVSFLCDPITEECDEPPATVAALCAAE